MSSHESRMSPFDDRPEDGSPSQAATDTPPSAEAPPAESEVPVDFAADFWADDDGAESGDAFAPPADPCECHCLHCGRTFSSAAIWFQKVINDPQGFKGFWMCPTSNCSGAGFTFDIFPTDPDHPANEGCYDFGDDEEAAGNAGNIDCDESVGLDDAELWPRKSLLGRDEAEPAEYDSSERRYKELDEIFDACDDDDLEGEEWKYGLQPGERPQSTSDGEGHRGRYEDHDRHFDEPDLRPRELDWSNRPDRRSESGGFSDEDLPF